jgi:hypothetical protein
METFEVKSLNSPSETRKFEKGKVELIEIKGKTLARAVFEPGWRWSTCVKPLVNTRSCEVPHFQYQVSGTLHVLMDDGTERDIKPGEVSYIPAGHDGWVVGNEPVILFDFYGMDEYAKEESKYIRPKADRKMEMNP